MSKTELHTALYWELTNNKAKCNLCPHYCVLTNGKTGICKVRINIENKLYTLAFGNLCAANIDPVEKKPLFHFLPSSKTFSIAINGCNFHCYNCQNWNISQSPPENNIGITTPLQIVNSAIKNNCKSISYTYTEPTIFYEFMLATAKLAKKYGLKNIMVSNGFINNEPLLELCKYLDAANIDLKCFDNNVYKKLTGGSLQPVLETINTLHKNNVWLEITNLIIPEYSNNITIIKDMCKWLFNNNLSEVPLHFSRFFPTYKLDELFPTPVHILEQAMKIAKNEGIAHVYVGNVINNDGENTFCNNCNKLLIKRIGYNVTEKYIINNKCKYCGKRITGIWD